MRNLHAFKHSYNFLSFLSYLYIFVMGTAIAAMSQFVMDRLDYSDRTVSQVKADQKVIQKSVSFAKRILLTVLLVRLDRLFGALVLYLIFNVTYIYI